MNPTTSLEISAESFEGKLGTEGVVGDVLLGVAALDEGRDHANVVIARGRRDQHVIWVPGDIQHGRRVQLNMLRHPPVAFLLEVANSNHFGARGDRKLVLARRPRTTRRRTTNTQQHQRGGPGVVLKTPHIRVTILRARQDTVQLVTPGQRGDHSIVLLQGLHQVKLTIRILVDLDGRIVGADRKQRAVRVPSVSGDGNSKSVEVDSHGVQQTMIFFRRSNEKTPH